MFKCCLPTDEVFCPITTTVFEPSFSYQMIKSYYAFVRLQTDSLLSILNCKSFPGVQISVEEKLLNLET